MRLKKRLAALEHRQQQQLDDEDMYLTLDWIVAEANNDQETLARLLPKIEARRARKKPNPYYDKLLAEIWAENEATA